MGFFYLDFSFSIANEAPFEKKVKMPADVFKLQFLKKKRKRKSLFILLDVFSKKKDKKVYNLFHYFQIFHSPHTLKSMRRSKFKQC